MFAVLCAAYLRLRWVEWQGGVLIGTDFANCFSDACKAKVGYEQAFREGRVQDYELSIRRRDGNVTPVLYNALVYQDDRGEVSGVFAAARDISERKRAESEVHKLTQELEQRVVERTSEWVRLNAELGSCAGCEAVRKANFWPT